MFSVARAFSGGSFAPLWPVNKAARWCHSCGGIRPGVTIISNTIIYFKDTIIYFRDIINSFKETIVSSDMIMYHRDTVSNFRKPIS